MIEAFLIDIWKRKVFVAFMFLWGAVFALTLRQFVPQTKYVYNTNYYVTNSELSKIVVDTWSLDTDAKMANSCKIILKSEFAMENLSEMLIEKYGVDFLSNYFTINYDDEDRKPYINEQQLSDCIDIEVSDDTTPVLSVEVTSPSAYLSQDIGSFLTFLAPNLVYYIVGVDYITSFENAQLKSDKGIFQSKKAVSLTGGIIGLALGFLIIYVYKSLSAHLIINRDDIAGGFGLSLLGQIPYYDIKSSIKEGKNDRI